MKLHELLQKSPLDSRDPIEEALEFLYHPKVVAHLNGYLRRLIPDETEAELCLSAFQEHLEQKNFEPLKAFSGRAQRKTFLEVLCHKFSIDYQRKAQGRNYGRKPQKPAWYASADPAIQAAYHWLVEEGAQPEQAFEQLKQGFSARWPDFQSFEKELEKFELSPRKPLLRKAVLKELELPPEAAKQEERSLQKQVHERLSAAFAETPAEFRLLVGLHFGDELSVPQIAKLLGKTPPTIRSHLEKGLQQVKMRLKEQGLDFSDFQKAFDVRLKQ